MMKTRKQKIDGVLAIVIEEREANLSRSEQFKELVQQEINAGERKLIISFINVDYVDSSFLGALVAILKSLLPLDGKLVLIGMNDDIVNLFQLTRLDKIFSLKDSLENALKEF
ncbi:STAS domain-containing protein [Pedobacter frigoris]|uniref:STAS domain-containing protein n=1 Tax=Pedobacter frigoris TaxID=2571272 RepID=A0A4U1CP70_9SPHI|nr:STAS domain-containing protein [Pedobacter frigoris]TKC09334.1 STAS domain-containing protein [Pedobacter frigoris]